METPQKSIPANGPTENLDLKNKRSIYWPTTLFLTITPLITLIAIPWYLIEYGGVSWSIVAFSLVFAFLTNLSITAGYHRLFSHRSYEAHPIVKLIFLLIGASAWQGSALKWSSDHRIHHSKVDSDDDPYSITKGFWYAHMGWLFYKESVDRIVSAPDLKKDALVMWQHKYYIPLALLMSFGVPTLIGGALGSYWAGFIFAGCLRVILTQQSTFLVNSLTHTLGKQTYSDEVSARDSLLVAFLTHGEGYHNFHHTFQLDYRNGIRWYQWDPTKWTIRLLWLTGLAKKLKKIPDTEILKARLQMEAIHLKAKGISHEKVEMLRARIITAQEQIRKLKSEYTALKKELSEKSHQRMEQIKADLARAQAEFKVGLQEWRYCLDTMQVQMVKS